MIPAVLTGPGAGQCSSTPCRKASRSIHNDSTQPIVVYNPPSSSPPCRTAHAHPHPSLQLPPSTHSLHFPTMTVIVSSPNTATQNGAVKVPTVNAFDADLPAEPAVEFIKPISSASYTATHPEQFEVVFSESAEPGVEAFSSKLVAKHVSTRVRWPWPGGAQCCPVTCGTPWQHAYEQDFSTHADLAGLCARRAPRHPLQRVPGSRQGLLVGAVRPGPRPPPRAQLRPALQCARLRGPPSRALFADSFSEPLMCAHRPAPASRRHPSTVGGARRPRWLGQGRGHYLLLPLDRVGHGPGIRLQLWCQGE